MCQQLISFLRMGPVRCNSPQNGIIIAACVTTAFPAPILSPRQRRIFVSPRKCDASLQVTNLTICRSSLPAEGERVSRTHPSSTPTVKLVRPARRSILGCLARYHGCGPMGIGQHRLLRPIAILFLPADRAEAAVQPSTISYSTSTSRVSCHSRWPLWKGLSAARAALAGRQRQRLRTPKSNVYHLTASTSSSSLPSFGPRRRGLFTSLCSK